MQHATARAPRSAELVHRPAAVLGLSLVAFPILNTTLNQLIVHSNLPLFMDSIFTAAGAALFGVWPAIASAVLTNLLAEFVSGFRWIHLPFAICGIATAVLVGRAARRGGLGSLAGAAAVVLGVTFANSLLGAIVAVFVFGGMTGVNIDVIVSGFAVALEDIFSAAFLARLPANLVDKSLAVAVAWWALRRFGPAPARSDGRSVRGALGVGVDHAGRGGH